MNFAVFSHRQKLPDSRLVTGTHEFYFNPNNVLLILKSAKNENTAFVVRADCVADAER